MKNIFGKLYKQKGASVIEAVLVLGTISLVIGGVTVKASDIFTEATDVQGIANVRQLTTTLELYYSDYEAYPQVWGASATERWSELISILKQEHLLASLPPKEGYDYQDLNSSQNYVISVLLENPESPYLELDWDGIIEGFNCNDPYYCLRM